MDFGFIAVLFCWRQHTPHGLVSPAGKFGWPDGSWLPGRWPGVWLGVRG